MSFNMTTSSQLTEPSTTVANDLVPPMNQVHDNDNNIATTVATTTLSQPQHDEPSFPSHVPLNDPTSTISSTTESQMMVIMIPPQCTTCALPSGRSRSWLPKSWRDRTSFGSDTNNTAVEAAMSSHHRRPNRTEPTTKTTINESKSVALLKEDHHHENDTTVTGITDHTAAGTSSSSSSRILQTTTATSMIRHRFRTLRLWIAASLSALPWIGPYCTSPAVWSGVIVTSLLLGAVLSPKYHLPYVKVAMIGNSMMYYNDFPRLMEELANGHLTQNSCLHGNANFRTILQMGVRWKRRCR